MNASRAFVSTFKEEYMVPKSDAVWLDGKQNRYAFFRALYNNSQYWKSEKISASFKRNFGVYKHARGVDNLYYRLVETLTSMLVGGAIDLDNLKSGAFHVVGADEALVEAIAQIITWSNWAINKSLYARLCAMLGDVGLWIVDDPQRKMVRVEVLDPAKIKDAEFDEIGNVKRVVIEYERDWVNPETGKHDLVWYRMEVDKEWFRTYKDDKLFAWQTDQRGNGVAEWPNRYGFVPLRIVKFKDVGFDWGASCYHTGIPKINEANDLGSVLDDGIRKAADPPWYLAGVDSDGDLEFSGQLDNGTSTTEPTAVRDDFNMLYGPEGSQPHSMAPTIPVSDINQRHESLHAEMERDAPVLAIARMRDKIAGMSGIAIRNMFVDADGAVKEAMANLDYGVVKAFQMAISIAALNGYDKFQGYSLDSYKQGAIDFYLKPREIFQDKFTPKEEVEIISALPSNPAAARYILINKLQMSEEDADEIIAGQVSQPVQGAGDIVDGQIVPQGQLPGQQPPQLTAGQGTGDNGGSGGGIDMAAVEADVKRIMSEIGAAA
jgi:hypothetical protein